jgi:hypothetical protein
MSSRRGRRGFTLAGTPADIAAKKLAAEKKKALQKDRFSALDFSSNCKDLPLQEFKGISHNEVSQIAFEQGQTNFNAKEYADKANEQERHEEYLNSLSKKDRKKVERKGGAKAAKIREHVSSELQQKKDDKDAGIIERLKQMTTIDDSIINDFLRLKTDTGVVSFLIEAIKIGLKCESDLVPHMYLELLHLECKEFQTQIKNVLSRVNTTLKMTPEKWIQTQMTEMSCYLPPLNKFSRREKKLDPWQKHIMKCIDEEKNVILVAKTSAGKTVCSTYAVWKASRVLYVLPSAELAEQVYGLVHNQLGGRTMMIINRDVFHVNDNVKVVVGTPHALESFLATNPEIEFDYTVYDEVHGLNGQEGDSLENLIKTVGGKFLALSATVENPEELQSWWKSIRPDIDEAVLIKHDSRFIVQQRYLWHNGTNEMETLHPLSAVDDIDYLQTGGLMKGTLSFTPADTYNLWTKIKDKFPDWSPEKYFGDQKKVRINLDDSKDYERFLKGKIHELSNTDPELIMSIMSDYKTDYQPDTEDKFEIYKMIRWLYSKKMTPALCFQLDQDLVQKMFYNLVKYLEDGEKDKYPWYRDDIVLQHDFYEKYMSKKNERLEGIKIPKGENPGDFKDRIDKDINQELLSQMQIKFTDIMSSRKVSINENQEYTSVQKLHHHKYCNEKLKYIMNLRGLSYTNPYQAHPEFSFNDGLVDDTGMREIKKRLSKQLGINLSYDHPLMLGIERGISMYFDTLPLPFQRVIKALFCDKKLTVLFSDDTLAYGVNMPVRSVALIGDNINPLVAQQMAGRAGRRGVDNQGHVIYVNSAWKNILKGNLPKIVGNNKINPYHVLRMNCLKQEQSMIESGYKITLSDHVNGKTYESQLQQHINMLSTYMTEDNMVSARLIWNLRRNPNVMILPKFMEHMLVKYDDIKQEELLVKSRELISELVTIFDEPDQNQDILPINSELNLMAETIKQEFGINVNIVGKTKTLVYCYTENRIVSDNLINIVRRFKYINRIIQEIHRVILKSKFDKNKRMLEFTFKYIKDLVSKY